jgi:hypothetical protein
VSVKTRNVPFQKVQGNTVYEVLVADNVGLEPKGNLNVCHWGRAEQSEA